ncbi:MAG: hypothetical protein AAF204_00215 [Pseudomonadota bacterium]
MFTALGNIFSVKPRQTEQSDTRQEIQRHDPDFERRKKKKNERQSDESFADNALVSVDALAIFLDNFVKNGAELPQDQKAAEELNDEIVDALEYEENESAETATSSDTYTQGSRSGQAAQAASVYQNISQANEKSKVLFETTDQSEGPPLDLSSADIRVIYALIEDLKTLSEANIEFLRIERAATFLDSLTTAVVKAKASIV